MKKSFGYLVVAGLVGSLGAGAVGSAPASAATLATATRLVLDTGGGDPNGGVGEAGVGDAGGVSTTLTSGGVRWTVFESLSSDLVAGDTNGAVDVFVTNGTTVTRLSVAANGTEGGSGLNSYDPEICSTGRKVAYVTENEFDIADANGAPDVYVIDRDADADGIFDEFASANAVTVSVVSVSYDTDLEENVVASNGAGSPRFSSDCTKVAFVTDEYFNVDDLNFGPDVYMNTLGSVATPAVWVSAFASGGAEGGGYLPALNTDGTKVTFVTDAVDVVSSSGTVGGLVISEVGASSVTDVAYASVKPNGTPSTSALIDTEYAPAISADGNCIAFKANSGFDLLAGNSGPAEGVYLWDNRGASPVVSLVSKITTGQAATSATAPRISADCRFIAYESNDDFISANDSNNRLDVYLYDTVLRTTQLISSNAAGNAADANSSLADLDYDATTGQGVVLVASGASNIRGASGGSADIDLFMVPFTASSSSFSALAPTRVFDTRQNIGGVGTAKIGDGRGNGTPLEFTVLNKGGLPASASTIGAVSLNVTVVDGEAPNEGGFVTVYPCGTRPDASNLNFRFGQTVPNAVITPVSAQGKVCFYVYGKAHLLADVNGYFTSGLGFNSVSPARLLDTRQNIGGVGTAKIGDGRGNGTPLEFTVTGNGGVPASGVGAVSLNVTVVDGEAPDEGGFVTVYPCGTRPDASNLNFRFGQTVPNAVITPVSQAGKVCFYVYGKAHLIADVNGYFGSSGFNSLTPARQFDTRQNIGGVGTAKFGDGRGNGTPLEFTVTGRNNVPASGVGAVSLNVTVVDGEAPNEGGFVTVYPCGTRPDASSLNFVFGQTVPNAVIAPVSGQGKVCFYVYGKAHLIVDVNGYFNQ